jgi:hypothetical protein
MKAFVFVTEFKIRRPVLVPNKVTKAPVKLFILERKYLPLIERISFSPG